MICFLAALSYRTAANRNFYIYLIYVVASVLCEAIPKAIIFTVCSNSRSTHKVA